MNLAMWTNDERFDNAATKEQKQKHRGISDGLVTWGYRLCVTRATCTHHQGV